MTPGTRPWRRIARAAPLPARGRAVALISLTVAMSKSSCSIATQTAAHAAVPPGRPPGVLPSRGCAAYSGSDGEKQERAGPASRPGFAGRGFQRRDARGERLVFLARQPGHFLDRLELLALDHVEVAQHALGLIAQERVELASHALRDAGGVIHQPRHL